MTDDEKLASPSFEDMDAGAIFGSDAIVIDDGASIFAPLEYETIIIDEAGHGDRTSDGATATSWSRIGFFEQVRFSAVAQAPIRTHRRGALPQSGAAAGRRNAHRRSS